VNTALKVILGNVLVLVAIVFVLNTCSAALLDVDFKGDFLTDERAGLPSYEDHERAALILKEFHQLETAYVPFVVWSRRPFQGETTTVNAEGDRFHPPTTDHPEAVVRFFGGSTMWGTGVDDAHTIPALFNARMPWLRVHNHGESAYHSRHELARLVNLVNQHEPMDLVVFYDGYNDAVNLCRPGVPLNGSHRTAQIDRRVNPPSHLGQALVGSIQEVLLGGFVSRVLFRADEQSNPCVHDPAHARRVAATLIENWRIAQRLAEMAGAEFIAILQPTASEGHPRVDYLDQSERVQPAVSLVYAAVREGMARENLGWAHDFTDVYDGDDFIFIDSAHANALGHSRVVVRLEEIAGPYVWPGNEGTR
jgi:hypothetical protein